MIPRLIALGVWAAGDLAHPERYRPEARHFPCPVDSYALDRDLVIETDFRLAGMGWWRGRAERMKAAPSTGLSSLLLILAAALVLYKRRSIGREIIWTTWPVFLFYGYLLLTVLWAESPVVSFKRWFKDFGNILLLL